MPPLFGQVCIYRSRAKVLAIEHSPAGPNAPALFRRVIRELEEPELVIKSIRDVLAAERK